MRPESPPSARPPMTLLRALWLVPAAACGITLSLTSPRPVAGPAEQAATAPWHVSSQAPDRARLLTQLGVDRWHAAGHRGRGVKVAVIDSGFRGYRTFLGGALPRSVL